MGAQRSGTSEMAGIATILGPISFIRRRLRFDLLKTTVISLRGYREKNTQTDAASEINDLDLNLTPEG